MTAARYTPADLRAMLAVIKPALSGSFGTVIVPTAWYASVLSQLIEREAELDRLREALDVDDAEAALNEIAALRAADRIYIALAHDPEIRERIAALRACAERERK